MKVLFLILFVLCSLLIYAQDEEVTESNTETVVDETETTSEEIIEDTETISEEIAEDTTSESEVVEEIVVEEEEPEPVKVPNTNSEDIKNRFKNIKTLKSTQEEEVKIDIRKPDDSSIMPRKETDFEYLHKREMEEKLKKSNRMLY